uniref:Uncharacterized protein n=1 Tax=Eiseniibacteriota bacterium TaxID=2212470 RepID=A0A832I5U6_UNCEI
MAAVVMRRLRAAAPAPSFWLKAAALAVAVGVAAAAPASGQSPAKVPELHDPLPDAPPANAPDLLREAERARPGAPQPPAGGPPDVRECLWIAGFDGLPADSLVRHAFLAGFRAGLGAGFLRAERPAPDGGEWIPTMPVTNPFQPIFGTSGFGCWNLQASFENVPPARGDSVPGLAITWILHSPAMLEANARPLPQRDTLWLEPVAPRGAEPRATRLGRAVATLGLERMLRMLGALDERDRLAIPGARRGAGRAPRRGEARRGGHGGSRRAARLR